jgi:hypothetical protein
MPAITSAPRRLGVLLILLVFGSASAAGAKTYSADRFDSRIEVQPGGTLRVTETVVFRFDGGPFKEVFRVVRSRNTDGLEFVSASMDGAPLPQGRNTGAVEVSGNSTMKVTWRFAPVTDATHTFELTYIARGVVRREGGADLLAWRALPDEHKYRIASSAIDIVLPASPVAPPDIEERRVDGETRVEVDDARVRVRTGGIRQNGWITARIRLPQGSVISAPPAWQARDEQRREHAPFWLGAGGVVLAAGLILLFAVRQGYDAPVRDRSDVAAGPGLPDSLAPAEAGALVSNGGARLEHAMAALFSLAERGELTISEEAKKVLGQRKFTLRRRQARRPVAPYEQAALDVIFTQRGELEDTVTLDKARSRLTHHFKRFSRPLQADLNARGLIDAGRKSVRDRFAVVGVALIVLAAVLPLPLALLLFGTYGPFPMVIPVAIALVAIVAFICHAAHTPLSNEGLRRARYWRAFRDHLKAVAQDRETIPALDTDRLLPYAVALGIADPWSKFLKQHRLAVPGWFHAAAHDQSAPAFVAFVAYGGSASSGGHGGHGGGMGGVAGGGASGAR